MPTARAVEHGRRSGGSGDLRHGNLTHILSYVRDNGPCSRHDIASGCGLGVSTLTDLISELRSRRLVRELDPVRRPGAGRPTRPISLDGEPWCVLGVHIDVDVVEVVASTIGGRELWSDTLTVPLRSTSDRNTFAPVAEVLREQVRRVPAQMELVAIEVGLPGYVIRDQGMVIWSRTLNWHGLPLTESIQEVLAGLGLQQEVHIGINADCQMAALHAGRNELELPADAVIAYVGGTRLVSSGLLVDGRTFGGARGGAGDIGHHRVDVQGGACWCGRTNCLQTVLSPVALLTRGGLLSAEEAEELVGADPHEALARLRAEAEAGNPQVLQALADGGDALGQTLDDVLGTLNPHAAVFGGFIGHLSEYLMPAVMEQLRLRLSYATYEGTQVVTLPLCDARAVRGAVLAARDACLEEPLRLTRAVA